MKNNNNPIRTATSVFSLSLLALPMLAAADRAGDRMPINAIHPAYALENVRPAALDFPIGGMDFLSDGSLVVTSWKDPYGVFILKNATGPKGGITVTQFANGLSETLGLKVVNDTIYILQKDELTALLDNDHDGKADEYRTIAMDWTKTTMEKEYATGLAYDGTYFYSAFGDPTVESGTAIKPAPAGRQNGVLRMSRDGKVEPFSGGMRVPGGIEYAFGEVWVTENQGGYRPSNYLMNIRQGRWYARPLDPPTVFQPIPYRALPDDGAHKPIASAFSIDLPFKEVGGRSPGNPIQVKEGPFKGQMFVPDADGAYGGICRVFLEKVKDEWQGAVFHFSRGFESKTVYRLSWGPDGALYAGANGSDNAGWSRNTHTGLDRLKPTGKAAFEMLALRSTGANLFEIEFTKPLAASLGGDVAAHLEMSRWWDRPQETYGGGRKQEQAAVKVNSAVVSSDRKKVTVTVASGDAGWEYYFHWKADAILSDANEKMWGTEAWYMLNNIGPGSDPVALEKAALPAGERAFTLARTQAGLQVKTAFPEGTAFSAQIADLKGRIHARRSGSGSQGALFNSSELPAGTYLVRVTAAGHTSVALGQSGK